MVGDVARVFFISAKFAAQVQASCDIQQQIQGRSQWKVSQRKTGCSLKGIADWLQVDFVF